MLTQKFQKLRYNITNYYKTFNEQIIYQRQTLTNKSIKQYYKIVKFIKNYLKNPDNLQRSLVVSIIALLLTQMSIITLIISIITLYLIKISLKQKYHDYRKKGILFLLPENISQGLQSGTLYELLCDLWHFENFESLLKFLIKPFFTNITPEEAIQSINELPESAQKMLATNGIVNTLPDKIREVIQPLNNSQLQAIEYRGEFSHIKNSNQSPFSTETLQKGKFKSILSEQDENDDEEEEKQQNCQKNNKNYPKKKLNYTDNQNELNQDYYKDLNNFDNNYNYDNNINNSQKNNEKISFIDKDEEDSYSDLDSHKNENSPKKYSSKNKVFKEDILNQDTATTTDHNSNKVQNKFNSINSQIKDELDVSKYYSYSNIQQQDSYGVGLVSQIFKNKDIATKNNQNNDYFVDRITGYSKNKYNQSLRNIYDCSDGDLNPFWNQSQLESMKQQQQQLDIKEYNQKQEIRQSLQINAQNQLQKPQFFKTKVIKTSKDILKRQEKELKKQKEQETNLNALKGKINSFWTTKFQKKSGNFQSSSPIQQFQKFYEIIQNIAEFSKTGYFDKVDSKLVFKIFLLSSTALVAWSIRSKRKRQALIQTMSYFAYFLAFLVTFGTLGVFIIKHRVQKKQIESQKQNQQNKQSPVQNKNSLK